MIAFWDKALDSPQGLSVIPVLLFLSILAGFPALLPNLLALWWLRGKPETNRLARVAAMGWAGFFAGLLSGLAVMWSMRKEKFWDDWCLLCLSAIFALAQLTMGINAEKAHQAMGWKPRERLLLARTRFALGGLVFFVLFGLQFVVLLNLWRVCPAGSGVFTPVGSLFMINTSAVTYASTYPNGYPANLKALGPPSGGKVNCNAAGLIDALLASGVEGGYVFKYKPGPPLAGLPAPGCPQRVESYTLTARPWRYDRCHREGYFTDQSGVIRKTLEDEPPTAQDPPLQ